MKRRLTIARSLINRPEILLLDEPTTGLDPQARHVLWDRLFRLKRQGVTLVLTTHYMDEAEQLCDRLVVMDHGTIVAEGSPRSLIDRLLHPRGARAAVRRRRPRPSRRRARGHRPSGSRCCPTGCWSTPTTVTRPPPPCTPGAVEPLSALVRRSSLEDVFLHLTGRTPGGLMWPRSHPTAPAPRPRRGTGDRSSATWLTAYRRTWRGSVVSRFLSPLLFLLSMGLGLGSLVDRSAGGVDGVPYLQYVVPGHPRRDRRCGRGGGVDLPGARCHPVAAAVPRDARDPDRCPRHPRSGTSGLRRRPDRRGHRRSSWPCRRRFGALPVLVGAAVPAGRPSWSGWPSPSPIFAFSRQAGERRRLQRSSSASSSPRCSSSPARSSRSSSCPRVLRPVAWVTPLWHGVDADRELALGSPDFARGRAARPLPAGVRSAVGAWLARRAFRRRLVV